MNDASSADSNTSEDLRQLAKAYHAFYEVLPYEVLIEEKGGSLSATTRKIQYGFDVDIYGVNPNTRVGKQLALPGHDPGSGCLDDLHRDGGLPDHPGRRRCRSRQQHRDRDGQEPGQRDRDVEHLADRHGGRAGGHVAADQVGRRDRR